MVAPKNDTVAPAPQTFKSANEMMAKYHELIQEPDFWYFHELNGNTTPEQIMDFFVAAAQSPFADTLMAEVNPRHLSYAAAAEEFSIMDLTEVSPDYFDKKCEYKVAGFVSDYDDPDTGKIRQVCTIHLFPLKHPEIKTALRTVNKKYLADYQAEQEYNAKCLDATAPETVKRILAAENMELDYFYVRIPHINWLGRFVDGEAPFDERKFAQILKHYPDFARNTLTRNYLGKFLPSRTEPYKDQTLRGARKRLEQTLSRPDKNSVFLELMRPICRGDLPRATVTKLCALIQQYATTLVQEQFKGQNGNYGYLYHEEERMNDILGLVAHKYGIKGMPEFDLRGKECEPKYDVYSLVNEEVKHCPAVKKSDIKYAPVRDTYQTSPMKEPPTLPYKQNAKVIRKHWHLHPNSGLYVFDIRYTKDWQPYRLACVQDKEKCPYNATHCREPQWHDGEETYKTCSNYCLGIEPKQPVSHNCTIKTYQRNHVRTADEIMVEFQAEVAKIKNTTNTKEKTL